MKGQIFLDNLRIEGKLELVELSEEICESYLQKADNCLKSAKILLQSKLYENSISLSYYAMYNSVIALFFKIGVKCENHSASILLIKKLFDREDLFKIISFAKKERIDKQYYVTSEKDDPMDDSANDMIKKSEDFLVQIKVLIKNLNINEIKNIREKYKSLFLSK